MKLAIRYFTKSKKGNTKKIADFVSKVSGVEALDVSHPLNEDVDQLLFINAMYAADVDKETKEFLKNNHAHIKCLININSSATGRSTYKAVKKVADLYDIKMSEREFHTVASWIFLNKGRPNEADFARLEAFLKEVL